MGSHGLHLIDRTFRRMWLDLQEGDLLKLMLIFSGILSMCFSTPFLTTPSAPMTTGTAIVFNPHIIITIIIIIITIIIAIIIIL